MGIIRQVTLTDYPPYKYHFRPLDFISLWCSKVVNVEVEETVVRPIWEAFEDPRVNLSRRSLLGNGSFFKYSGLHIIEEVINDGYDYKGQEQRCEKAAYCGDCHWRTGFSPFAYAYCNGHHAQHHGKCGHQDWSQTNRSGCQYCLFTFHS